MSPMKKLIMFTALVVMATLYSCTKDTSLTSVSDMEKAAPKPMMKINTKSAKPVNVQFSINMIPQNTGNGPEPSTDATWLSYIQQLTSLSDLRDPGGSLAIFTNYYAGANGYGGSVSDCNKRGLNFSTVVNGSLAQTYGFESFQSDIDICASLGLTFSPVMNLSTPIIDCGQMPYVSRTLNYTRFKAQVNYIISACQAKGVNIGAWYLGEESQASGTQDVFPTLDVFTSVTSGCANYIHSLDASAKIVCDGNISDDATCRFDHGTSTMNAAMAGVANITGKRDYFQIQNFTATPTMPMMWSRLAEFPSYLDKFRADFPSPFEFYLTQQQFGYLDQTTVGTNPYTSTWGQGAIMSELMMRCVSESGNRNLPIHFSLSQINGLVSGAQNSVKPEFYSLLLLQSALISDGLVTVSFQNIPGSENLFAVAVLRGSKTEVYALNKGDSDITIPMTQINGVHKNMTVVDGWGGEWMDGTATNYAPNISGDNITFKAHYLEKIVSD